MRFWTDDTRKRVRLRDFFYRQLETLKVRHVPDDILSEFHRQEDAVVAEVLKIWREKYADETFESLAAKGIYLAFPVLPQSIVWFNDLMTMVRNGSKEGFVPHYMVIKTPNFVDTEKTPVAPYYVFDADDGRAHMGGTPYGYTSRLDLVRAGRRSNTAAETIALSIHTDVLLRHRLWVVGSYFGGEHQFLNLGLNADMYPVLNWGFDDDSESDATISCCASRRAF